MLVPLRYRQAIIEAVREAGRVDIVPRFRHLANDQIAEKTGPLDLVTIADREAEARIGSAVGLAWPEALIVGEEAVSSNSELLDRLETAEWAVIIDPVDGTWNFAKGLAVFGTIIAVVYRGVTVWGMLYDPLFDDWIEGGPDQVAQFYTAQQSQNLKRAENRAPNANELTGYVPLFLFGQKERKALSAAMLGFARVANMRCSCQEYRMVLQGHADFVLACKLNPWDHLGASAILRGQGGVARLLDGREYDVGCRDGVLLFARSPQIWDCVAEQLTGCFE